MCFCMFKLSLNVLEDKGLACPSLPSSLPPSVPPSFLHPSFPFSLLPSLSSFSPSFSPLFPQSLSYPHSLSLPFIIIHFCWFSSYLADGRNSWFNAWTWGMKAWPLSLTCMPGCASTSSSCSHLFPSVLSLILGPTWEQLWSQESMVNSYG